MLLAPQALNPMCVSSNYLGACEQCGYLFCSGDAVINYTKVDLPEEVRRVTGGQGAGPSATLNLYSDKYHFITRLTVCTESTGCRRCIVLLLAFDHELQRLHTGYTLVSVLKWKLVIVSGNASGPADPAAGHSRLRVLVAQSFSRCPHSDPHLVLV